MASKSPSVVISFVDIDDDGDQDCFLGLSHYDNTWPAAQNGDRILYYKNTGSPTAPDFVLQTPALNPLQSLTNAMPTGETFIRPFYFFDGDVPRDAKLDVLAITQAGYYYHENLGTVTAPSFNLINDTPIDVVVKDPTYIGSSTDFRGFEDVDLDGDLDLIMSNNGNLRYYQNVEFTNVSI